MLPYVFRCSIIILYWFNIIFENISHCFLFYCEKLQLLPKSAEDLRLFVWIVFFLIFAFVFGK